MIWPSLVAVPVAGRIRRGGGSGRPLCPAVAAGSGGPSVRVVSGPSPRRPARGVAVSPRKRAIDIAIALIIVLGAGLLSWRTGSGSLRGFHEVQLAPADIPIPVGIAPSPDGSVWFTLEASGTLGILRDGTVRKLPKGVDSVEPLGLAIDAGGRVSFAKTLSDSLGTIRDPRAMAASRA